MTATKHADVHAALVRGSLHVLGVETSWDFVILDDAVASRNLNLTLSRRAPRLDTACTTGTLSRISI